MLLTIVLYFGLFLLGCFMWLLFASLNPAANCDSRRWALIKTKGKDGKTKYDLTSCKKFVLKEFKETKNMEHVTKEEYESLYFYDRENVLYSYNPTKGLQKMSDVYKAEILDNFNCGRFNIINYLGVKRFRSIIELELYDEAKN